MSTNIRINATQFGNGATYFDLSTPSSTDSLGVHVYEVVGSVGLIDLETVPNMPPSVGIWMQVAAMHQQTNPAALFTLALVNPTSGVEEGLFVNQASPDSVAWNVLIPQKGLLRLSADDGAAGDEGGALEISFWPYAATEWPYLQCCHKFGPYEID